MKALLASLALAVTASAQITVITPAPVRTAPVLSPLTTGNAQSNQALLNQINATITQRNFQHQVLTIQQPVRPVVISPGPNSIRFSK